MTKFFKCYSLVIIISAMFTSCKKNGTVEQPRIINLTKAHILGVERPFLQGHASTLVATNDNQFLVAWFAGTEEKHDDVGIWISKGDSTRWSAPIEVAKIREDAHWNPVLFKTNSGEIILYFKVGKTIDEWETWFIKSADSGMTWTQPKELVAGDHGGRGPVKNKPIRLSNGNWLAGASNENDGIWNAFVDISEDEGNTWNPTKYLDLDRDSIIGEGIIQPTLWESRPGHVHMLLRSSSGYICRSDSEDYGKTWNVVYKTDLPNPNSGIDITKLQGNKLALVYNRDNKNWGERNVLSIAVSSDNGKTWPVNLDIESGKDGDEYSYPAIVSTYDTIAVTYTWNRQNIAFWKGIVR